MCEAWEAGERARLFIVEQSADDGWFFFLDAHSLRERAVGNDGDTVDTRSGEGANLELQLQRHFVIRVQGGRSLDLDADVFILRAGIRLLRDAASRHV